MTARFAPSMLGLAIAGLLAGCTTTNPTKVTRFNLSQPIAPGPVAITPRNPNDSGGLAFSTTAGAVSAELNRLDFAPAAPDDASTPRSRSSHSTRPPGRARRAGRRSAWHRRGDLRRHSGFGGGVDVPIARGRESYIDFSLFIVELKRRATARSSGGPRLDRHGRRQPGRFAAALSQKLATALFRRDFPGASGQTIMVK